MSRKAKRTLWISGGAVLLLVLFAGIVYFALLRRSPDPYTPPILGEDGNPIPGAINAIEPVVLGGVAQTITIRGVDASNPVLLHLHGGPGMPSSPWATWNDYYADLEANFVLVHWDQRGAGKSYHKDLTADDMHLENFVSDALELTDILRQRFGREKIFLWGHSWGSGLGFETIRANPEPFYAFFASAVRPEWNASQELAYEHVLQLAREAGDAEAVEALTAIQPFDATNAEHLGVLGQVRTQYLVGEFHTAGLEEAWLDYARKGKSPEYPPATIRGTLAGLAFSRETIGTEIVGSGYSHPRDFPVSEIPVYFVVGRYDWVTPGVLAEEYYEMLEAPAKEFLWFENSAHDVHFDEAGRFSQEIVRISQQVLDASGSRAE